MKETAEDFEATGTSTVVNLRDYGDVTMLSSATVPMVRENQKSKRFKNLPKMLVASKAIYDRRTYSVAIQRCDVENLECYSFASVATSTSDSNLKQIVHESSSIPALNDSEEAFALVPDGSCSATSQSLVSVSHCESDDFYYHLLATMNQLDFAKRRLDGTFCCSCGFMNRRCQNRMVRLPPLN